MVEKQMAENQTSQTPARLSIETTIFLECDLQENMVYKIIKGNVVLHNAIRLAKVAKLLEIPLISSKHAKSGKLNPAL